MTNTLSLLSGSYHGVGGVGNTWGALPGTGGDSMVNVVIPEILYVHCKLKHSLGLLTNKELKQYLPFFGTDNIADASIPHYVTARFVPHQDYREAVPGATPLGGNSRFDDFFGSTRDMNQGTPLDPVWTTVRWNGDTILYCSPGNLKYDITYKTVPEFDVSMDYTYTTTLTREVRTALTFYVARLLKQYEIDNLSFPEFQPTIEEMGDNIIEADDENGILSEFDDIMNALTDTTDITSSTTYLVDEDVELATVSIKKAASQLETLKGKISTVDANLTKQIAITQNDLILFQRKISGYQQRAVKLNKDVELLRTKYNESIAAMNGQPFIGKASKNELDKLKQEVSNLKQQISTRGKA